MIKGRLFARWVSLALLSTLLASYIEDTHARSTGAPVDTNQEICSSMLPGHQLPATITTSPYTMTTDVSTFSASQQVTVTITKTSQSTPGFKGIFLQMRRVDNDQIEGSWYVDNSDTNFQSVDCDGSSNNAVTHRNSNQKGDTNTFVWNAPATKSSDVKVVATFVQSYSVFWVQVQGPTIQNTSPCNPNPCLSGGTCEISGTGFVCMCPPLYSGPTCHLIVFPCDSNPCQNGGTCTDTNQETEFVCSCTFGFMGTVCEVASDPCSPNPCLAGGTCVPDGDSFTCNCPPLNYGRTCHFVLLPCDSNPCQNGGTCTDTNQETEFVCSCTSGFMGTVCEVASDPCSPNPCLAGGTCMPDGDSFTCNCPPLNYGRTCHFVRLPCDPNPCVNGGTCENTNQESEFQCSCLPGFTGVTCELVIACNSSPCANGGTCINVIQESRYFCSCLLGYSGLNCQTAISPCEDNSCENGATCNGLTGNSSYTCTCPADYTGILCETSLVAATDSTPGTTADGTTLACNLFIIVITICGILIAI